MSVLTDSHGVLRHHMEELENIILDHFKSIFTSSQPTYSEIQQALRRIKYKLNLSKNAFLLQSFIWHEAPVLSKDPCNQNWLLRHMHLPPFFRRRHPSLGTCYDRGIKEF